MLYYRNMANGRDRILLVESDPVVADLIGRQALQSVGYQVVVVGDGNSAIARAVQWNPDLVLANLNLPGLSGKDLMVALQAQGLQMPVILLANRGQEADIVQAFRLGATDYLLLPVREAEVVSAVERALKQVHERRERERLQQQLQQTNQELQQRVRELTTIYSVGKAVTSITDLSLLMDRILEGAVTVTQADVGWFLLRDEDRKPFVLVASTNLPNSLGAVRGKPWDDSISGLVAMSGEPLSIHGEPLKRFKISSLGQAALIVPIKAVSRARRHVVGLLVMMRRAATAFSASEQHLLEALADYASIALTNAHLFRAAEERARSLELLAQNARIGERINYDILNTVRESMASPIAAAADALNKLGKDPTARWRPDQRQLLSTIQEKLDVLHQIVEAIPSPPTGEARSTPVKLNDLIRQSVSRAQKLAQPNRLTLTTELPPETVAVNVEASLLEPVLDSVLATAMRLNDSGSPLVIRLEREKDGSAHLQVRVSGVVLPPADIDRVMNDTHPMTAPSAPRFSGLGIRMKLIQEILSRQNAKIWLESQSGKGTVFHLSLPSVPHFSGKP